MDYLNRKLLNMAAGMLLVLPASGYSVEFAQKPLSVGNAVEPNVMFLLDDSGSMGREYMPDAISNAYGANRTCIGDSVWWGCDGYWEYDGETASNRWYYSGVVNTVYYNPDITYTPPYEMDGSDRFPDSSLTAAFNDGYAQSWTRNLTNDFRHRGLRFEEPFYWDFDASSESCVSDPRQNSCYTYVSVSDLDADEQQNFANWYSYYRTRMFASRAGIGEAFYDLANNFRLGWGRINKGTDTIDGSDSIRSVIHGVRAYDEAHKEDFYEFLYGAPTNGQTPLRAALEGAGLYYETSARSWADDPAEDVNSVTNPERECRLAYTILMTDGLWNDAAASDSIGNSDAAEGEVITGPNKSYQYSPQGPFEDSHSNTLADVAMHFWKRDLRPGLDNLVPQKAVKAVTVDEDLDEEPYISPAFWQHMVTYGVGLGVEPESEDPEDAFRKIRSGGSVSWPEPGNNRQANIDDLLHAGVNSHGGFFSAADPSTFSDELAGVLAELTADPGSATAAEVAGETVAEGELLFAASYDPSDWSGDLRAGALGTGNDLIPDFETIINTANGWSAAAELDDDGFDPDARVVVTFADGKGSAFRWADLEGTAAGADLSVGGDSALGEARLNYIRGDQSREGVNTAPSFRKRESLLGSIVNSSPNYVGNPSSGWPDSEPFGVDGERYSSYVEAAEGRTPIVYAGANDGMLHGFQATLGAGGGSERLAYIPGFLYSTDAYQGLHYLTDPDYSHRYYVDLATRKQDVYSKGRRTNNGNPTSGRDWRTVLVGGARAGGKGIFALDVTNPGAYSEDDAPGLALWEFSAEDDDRLGYITQPPVVALSEWGGAERWTVFVANGYNSDDASTGFFMLDIEGGLDGTWTENDDYRYVEFENSGDGLSPLTVLDTTGDYMADRIYAGDLDGNIWVASNQSGTNWAAVSSAPLFSADGPVTGAPAVASNKDMPRATNEPNLMVYFGTGKYLETSDLTDTSDQAFYGVWDDGTVNLDTGDLIERVLEEEQRDVDGETMDIRISEGDPVNYNTHHGWFAELNDVGERVVNNPVVRGDYVYINTIIPSTDPCEGGGSGWIMGFGRMGGIVVDNAKAFSRFPSDTQGYRTGGMPSQITIRGETLLYDESGDDPKGEGLPPLGGDIPGAGRRGWHELIE
ncbi:pilus assembly protein [Marinobacter sp.]|uniref:pilus assembly protein n=1 Tax=Marinobacter sp. TaxID=50741 RepID=UPI0035620D65